MVVDTPHGVTRVLGSPRNPDKLTERVEDMAQGKGVDPGDLTIRTLRRGGTRIVVGVAAHVACMATEGPDGSGSTSCGDAGADTDRLRMAVDVAPGGKFRLTGLFMNPSIPQVMVTDTDGREITLPVTDAVFTTLLDHQPTAVKWTTDAGDTRTQIIRP